MAINFDAMKTSWEAHTWGNFKVQMTRIPATQGLDNVTGGEDLEDGTSDTDYYGVFYRQEDEYTQEVEGLFQGADAVVLIKTSQTLNRNDILVYNGEQFRVRTQPVARKLGSTELFKVGRLFKIGDSG